MRWSRVAQAGSVGLAAAAIWAAHFPLACHILQGQRHEILTFAAVLVWPAVIMPWLPVVPNRWRNPAIWLAAPVGLFAQGQPVLLSIDPHFYLPLIPNERVLPWAFLAGCAGMLFHYATRTRPVTHARVSLSLVIAAGLVLVPASSPVRSTLALAPGEVAVGDLRLVDTFVLDGIPAKEGLAGFAWQDCLIIVGRDRVAWRSPDGPISIAEIPLDPLDVEVYGDGPQVYVLEKRAGRLRCFACPTGELRWETEGLGTVNEYVFTAYDGWFLDYCDRRDDQPGSDEEPLSTIRLHRVDLGDGRPQLLAADPPPGTYWAPSSDDQESTRAQLRSTGDLVYLVGCGRSYTEGPRHVIFVTVPAQPGNATAPSTLLIHEAVRVEDVIGVAQETVVYMHAGDQGTALSGRDLATGQKLWTLPLGACGFSTGTFAVLPNAVLVDYGGLMPFQQSQAPTRHQPASPPDAGADSKALVCYHPRSGKEMWRSSPGGVKWAEAAGSDALVMRDGGLLTRLDASGRVRWTYQASEPAYLLSIEESSDRMVLFESGARVLPGSGWWGIETTIRLSDGTVLSRPATQPGRYNYTTSDGVVYRTPGTRRGSRYRYLSEQPVLRMEGPHVFIQDPIRHAYWLATSDLLCVACRLDGDSVKVYLLKPQLTPH